MATHESVPGSLGYKPLPPTEKREPIRTALRVLLDPAIPQEHAEGNHNCGECWSCIYGTILLAGVFRKERKVKNIDGLR